MVIESHEFEQLLKFWKPEDGKEYNLVVFTDWKIRQGTFGQELTMKVASADGEQYHDKDFNTKSSSFIVQVRPIILNAQKNGYSFIAVALKYGNKKYTIFDKTEEIMKNVARAVPKSFPGVVIAPPVVPQ